MLSPESNRNVALSVNIILNFFLKISFAFPFMNFNTNIFSLKMKLNIQKAAWFHILNI